MCVSGPFTGLTAAGGWLQIQSGKTKLVENMLGLASIALLEHKMFVYFWFTSPVVCLESLIQRFHMDIDLISNKN